MRWEDLGEEPSFADPWTGPKMRRSWWQSLVDRIIQNTMVETHALVGVCCRRRDWYPVLDPDRQVYFTKLIEEDTGKVLYANNAGELRCIALAMAKTAEYVRGSLYFVNTRIYPRPEYNRRCIRGSDKWRVDASPVGADHITYYRIHHA